MAAAKPRVRAEQDAPFHCVLVLHEVARVSELFV